MHAARARTEYLFFSDSVCANCALKTPISNSSSAVRFRHASTSVSAAASFWNNGHRAQETGNAVTKIPSTTRDVCNTARHRTVVARAAAAFNSFASRMAAARLRSASISFRETCSNCAPSPLLEISSSHSVSCLDFSNKACTTTRIPKMHNTESP